MSLTTAQQLKLKNYLNTNPDSIAGLAAMVAASHWANVETAINAVFLGAKARLNTVDGSSFRATLASLDNWVTHASKTDVYALVPQGPMTVNDTVIAALNKLLGVGGPASQTFTDSVTPFVTKTTDVTYVQALFNNADMFVSESSIAEAMA